MDIPSKRGGKRPGAGRKTGTGKYGEPTKVLRVPVSKAASVLDFLDALQRRHQAALPGNVEEILPLRPSSSELRLPLYTSKVSAGFPSAVDDHVDKRLNPSEYLIENDDSTFFVRVKGDSMIDAGIFEDDVLVIDRSGTAQVGDIVLAVLDGEFTVKTLGRSRQGVRLIPANRHYPVIEVGQEQSFEIWGVVTGSMRKFK